MKPVQHILVPVDYSICMKTALQWAFWLAGVWDATLHLLHVVETEGEEGGEGVGWTAGFAMGTPLQAGEADTPHPVRTVRHVLRQASDATRGILEYLLEEPIDLVVMGTHGNRSMKRFLTDETDHWLVGKTTEEVVAQAHSPVLTISPRSHPPGTGRMPILVPVSCIHEGRGPFEPARALAASLRLGLDLLYVIPPDHAVTDPERTDLLQRLHQRYPADRDLRVHLRYHVTEGRADREIPAFAERHHLSMIVLEAGSPLVGPVVRASACPVLVARATVPPLSHMLPRSGWKDAVPGSYRRSA
jgi:nucleotide-binding universal stress UspA family protein